MSEKTDFSQDVLSRIDGRTLLTGLLGHPVAHSLSPLMHNDSFRRLGLNYAYLCFDVEEERLSEAVTGLRALGVRGFNLTMPNKNKMAELADDLSPAARIVGAVNTVVNEGGRLIGYNTDGIGYIRSLMEEGYDICGKTITMLGAGGAATAIAAQAALSGADRIHIFARPSSRFHTRTLALLDRIRAQTSCRARIFDLANQTALEESISQSSLLVNASSVGMSPGEDQTPLPNPEFLHTGLLVSDIIYKPRKTRLLREAEAAGCAISNGLHMLLYQGAEAFRLWTGQDMPTEWIRQKYFSE